MEKINPTRFVELGYLLAIVSSGAIFASLVFGLIGWNLLANIVWLALISSGVGLFLTIAGRNDFERGGGVPEGLKIKSRVGFRINIGVLAIMIFILVFYILFALRLFG